MDFWTYSAIIPIGIILISIFVYRPLNFQRITKGLTISLIPLVTYTLLVYFLEMENYIDSSWAFFSLIFFFVPYVVTVLILNVVLWNRKRKV